MLNILLCFAFVSQSPAQNDLNFAIAVERSVWAATTGTHLEHYVGKRHARLIRLLGSNDYEAREEAHYQLGLLGEVSRRALIYGTWHKDIEVQQRSWRLLHEMSFCVECHGTGYCILCNNGCVECGYRRICETCNGEGKK